MKTSLVSSFALAATTVLMAAPVPAFAIAGRICVSNECCVGNECFEVTSRAQQNRLTRAMTNLNREKPQELALARSCEISGMWIYNPNPALMGYCLPTSPRHNPVTRCNVEEQGVWIYGAQSYYPALDLELGNPLGGIGGYCWQSPIPRPSVNLPAPLPLPSMEPGDFTIQCAMNPHGGLCEHDSPNWSNEGA